MTIHRQPPWKQLRQQPIPTLSRGLEIGVGSVFVSPLYQKLRATWMRRSAAPVASVRTAVVAHVYYPEFWPEIVQVWRTLPAGSPLIVTTTHDRVDEIRALAGADRL